MGNLKKPLNEYLYTRIVFQVKHIPVSGAANEILCGICFDSCVQNSFSTVVNIDFRLFSLEMVNIVLVLGSGATELPCHEWIPRGILVF